VFHPPAERIAEDAMWCRMENNQTKNQQMKKSAKKKRRVAYMRMRRKTFTGNTLDGVIVLFDFDPLNFFF